MLPAAAGLFVFLALLAGAAALLGAPRLRRRRVDERVRALVAPDAEADARSASGDRRRSLPTLSRLLSSTSWAAKTALELRRAGISLTVGEYLLARALLALALVAAVLLALGPGAAGLLLAAALGALGYLLPAALVRSARLRRRARIEAQLIELLPSLASSLRAGFGLQQGIESAAEQIGAPLEDELSALLRDAALGAPLETALEELGRRVGSADLDMVITAILVQRTTGGGLADVLDQAAATLRERERIAGEIQTFTAQQRLTGLVLSVYPIGVGLVLLAIMPSIWSQLFTERAGQAQLAIAGGLQVIGFLMIRRIVRVEV
jgi:tight adherence protein B